MSRRNRAPLPLSRRPVPEAVRARIRSPLAVVLGSPAEVIHLLHACDGATAVCYQMDLYQAERLRDALAKTAFAATIEVLPDLWDLPADFQSAVYMPARGGERELKIDMIEQAFHILRPGGSLTVWSSYETDPFFPALLKKVFGRVHENRSKVDAVFWGNRPGDRRREIEIAFLVLVHHLQIAVQIAKLRAALLRGMAGGEKNRRFGQAMHGHMQQTGEIRHRLPGRFAAG